MFIGSFVMLFFTHGPIENFLQLGLDFLLADFHGSFSFCFAKN